LQPLGPHGIAVQNPYKFALFHYRLCDIAEPLVGIKRTPDVLKLLELGGIGQSHACRCVWFQSGPFDTDGEPLNMNGRSVAFWFSGLGNIGGLQSAKKMKSDLRGIQRASWFRTELFALAKLRSF
jgi:hypothetical protein